MKYDKKTALGERTSATELAATQPHPTLSSYNDESQSQLKDRYSMSALHHKYRIWIERGVVLGKLVQELSISRLLRHPYNASSTGQVSIDYTNETELSTINRFSDYKSRPQVEHSQLSDNSRGVNIMPS